ncbi:hypothetical protein XENORESO_012440, partial [Xenotaenia resolanae]
ETKTQTVEHRICCFFRELSCMQTCIISASSPTEEQSEQKGAEMHHTHRNTKKDGSALVVQEETVPC